MEGNTKNPGQRIAIVGSGISGLTSAYLLSRNHNITVFEAEDYLGGHTHTVPVELEGQFHQVDTGFIVCNDRNYDNFMALMKQLGVKLQPTEMSFSVNNPALNLEYNGHTLNTLFGQRLNLLRPRFYALVRDILRFNNASKKALRTDASTDMTLDEFISKQNLGTWIRECYLLPMVAAIWSCSIRQAGEFPLRFFLRFFLNHGLLDIKNRPQWYVVKGGSHSYIRPMTRNFADRTRLLSPVTAISRTAEGVEVRYKGRTELFDQVILACHSNQALSLLNQPSKQEKNILSELSYQENEVVLHSDPSLMPGNRRCWASWNFLAGERSMNSAPIVTYSMNILQGLQSSSPLLVSLNASDRIAQEKIIRRFRYAHPVYSTASVRAQQRRSEICGVDRIHFCGAYWYDGFHEDGVRSALDVAERFGERL